MLVIVFSSLTEIKAPERKVTPLKPKEAKIEEPFSSRIADTTASSLTMKPRNLPVLADVPESTFEPVKPAINSVAELILIDYKVLFEDIAILQ